MDYPKSPMPLIEKLYEGGMASHPVVKQLIQRTLTTGDAYPLYDYVERHRVLEVQAERNLDRDRYERLDNPYRPYPSRDDVRLYLSGGSVQFGYVNEFNDRFSAHPDIFCTHAMNAGGVGTGKSALAKYILCQLFRKPRDFNVIIPDLKKEYRDLLPYCRALRVLKVEQTRFNPFEVPQWSTPADHILSTAKVFISENYLLGTSLNEIVNVLRLLYSQRGIFDGGNNYPTMVDVHAFVTAMLNRNKWGRYTDVLRWLQNRLFPYTFSEQFRCSHGIPFETFERENLVLEMDTGFTDKMYNFAVAHIAEMLFSYYKAAGLVGSKLRTLFVVDEARVLFNANRDTQQWGESTLSEVVSKSREYGLGFFISSQEMSSFSQVIRSLSRLKIAFPLNDAKDVNSVRESFGLDDDQADYLFRLPRYGQAVVRYSGYEKPFLLAVPHFRVKRHLTDEEVDARMAGFFAHLNSRIKAGPRRPQSTNRSMPVAAASLLYYLSKEPYTKVSEMTRAPGFKSPAEVNKALAWLEKNGLIRRESYRVSRRGRKAMYAVLTEEAFNLSGVERRKGKGNFEHSLYQDIIRKKIFSQELDGKIEGRIRPGDKACDVLVRDLSGRCQAYEVTLHFENLVENILRDFASGADEVIVVARDEKGLEKAMEIVSRDSGLDRYLEAISFRTIVDFFE